MNLVPALRGETPFYRINTANVLPSSYTSSLQALGCVKSCKLGNHSFLFLKPRTLKASHVVWTIHTGMSKKASASSRELRNLAFVYLHMTVHIQRHSYHYPEWVQHDDTGQSTHVKERTPIGLKSFSIRYFYHQSIIIF